MTQYLPSNLLALFAPRDPIAYFPPVEKLPHEKKNRGYQGVGAFLKYFDDDEPEEETTKPETREERIARRKRERAEQAAYKLEQEIALWDPLTIAKATGDPFKTLFVARINYDTTESKLRREFEQYGSIRKIVMVHNKTTGKPVGYAFIEYEHERDMHSAYKHADGKKIDSKRVLVDVERGRTVKGWLPRRLGGGLGGTRRGGADVNLKHSGREDNERERERYRLEREESMSRDRRRGGAVASTGRDFGERRRSRSRERDRERRRRTRSRSRERRRRDSDVDDRRDRDRHKKRKRSRSRSRDKERKHRRERDDSYDRKDKIRIKEEPVDDYPDFSQNNTDEVVVKQEEDHQNGMANLYQQYLPAASRP